jgi:cytochrome c oxidase assembly factor CtaG
MDPALTTLLQSWTFDPWLMVPLDVCAVLYLRGWWQLHGQMPQRFGVWRLGSFQSGLLTLFLALASPLERLAEVLLQAHMVQHLVLMMVAPLLIVCGMPALPLLRGLPHGVLKRGLGPLLAWPVFQRLERWLTHPVVAWLAFAMATVAWHVPALYELALHSHFWHHVQHLCFLSTGVLFWWPVLQPWPSRPHWPRWAMIPYLLLADLQNTALSAALIFSERLLYPTYMAVPRLWGISALDDQAAAGAIMWVPGALVYLVPVGLLVIRLLDAPRAQSARTVPPSSVFLADPTTPIFPPQTPKKTP